MIFTELRFLAFFALVFVVFWASPGWRWRKGWLLLASYAFYAAWDWRFLGLILLSTLVDFGCGLRIHAAPPASRRRWLAVSVITNLGLLAAFKYLGFFVDSAAALLAWLGLPCPTESLRLVLPIGISFYTFQSMSYTIDVHRGTLAPTRSLLDFALFVAFFPQLVAGPIVRARDFLPQLAAPTRLLAVPARWALTLFFIGFFKKACIADNLAPVATLVLSDPGSFSPLDNLFALLAFHVRIYCDFSGYSDMAIASAALLGFRLPTNFDFPYLASSVRSFWSRWHMSLSGWLRDYVYIPLGGNRRGSLRTDVNVVITMTLCGLWHGAGWNYVLFGALHGAFLLIERRWRMVTGTRRGVVWKLAGFGWMTAAILAGWVLFATGDLSRAGVLAARLGDLPQGGGVVHVAFWWLIAVFIAGHVVARTGWPGKLWSSLPTWLFVVLLGVAVALAMPLAPTDHRDFVYFQF